MRDGYPRIPPPPDGGTFDTLASLGKQLREIHLLEGPKLTRQIYTPSGAGDWLVQKVRYRKTDNGLGKVFVNDTQFFEGVPGEAFEFKSGGYQAAQQWLKDRKGRRLAYSDLLKYQQIVEAQRLTHILMKEIDLHSQWISEYFSV